MRRPALPASGAGCSSRFTKRVTIGWQWHVVVGACSQQRTSWLMRCSAGSGWSACMYSSTASGSCAARWHSLATASTSARWSAAEDTNRASAPPSPPGPPLPSRNPVRVWCNTTDVAGGTSRGRCVCACIHTTSKAHRNDEACMACTHSIHTSAHKMRTGKLLRVFLLKKPGPQAPSSPKPQAHHALWALQNEHTVCPALHHQLPKQAPATGQTAALCHRVVQGVHVLTCSVNNTPPGQRPACSTRVPALGAQ